MTKRRCELGAKPSICFVETSKPMVDILTSGGEVAMGGGELQLFMLAHALRKEGWSVLFLVGDYGQPKALRTADGFPVVRAYCRNDRPAFLPLFIGSVRQFWRSLGQVNADVYMSRGLWGQAGVIAAFARRYRRKYVLWFARNWDAQYGVPWLSSQPLIERLPAWYAVHHADAVVAQSNDQNKLLRKHTGRDGVVIPNVSPWEDSTAPHVTREHVLWIGSIRPVKRPHMFLDVAERLPRMRFVMAGGEMRGHSELYDAVAGRADKLSNVDFLGFVPYDETMELFQRAHVVVSTSESEGFPNVFLQAWSTGTPVVATVDPDGVISANGLGYYCRNATQMVERIREIAEDDTSRGEIGRRGRAYVSKRHSPDRIGSQLDSLLRELIDD